MREYTVRTFGAALLVPGFCFALGCEDEKPKAAAAATASAVEAAPAPTPTASAPAEAPAKAKPERPASIELELTAARRSAVEAKYPQAKGFLEAKELEESLKANKAIKAKEAAVAALDRAAKGKWVLFAGTLVNPTDTGFDLGIVYTPQMAGDVMGMSRQFFEVTLSEIEGYEADAFKAGNSVVVLAKYQGGGKAGPGHELVAADVWK